MSQPIESQPIYKVARTRDELEAAFKLVYQAYYRIGLVCDNPSGLRLTPFHMRPESEVLIARIRGEVFSTISLFGDSKHGLPMDSMYPNEIDTLRNNGCRIIEVGSLADRRIDCHRFIDTLAQMGRLLGQMSEHQGYDTLVAVTHPRHAKIYKRILGFSQMGEASQCPYANGNPAVALYLKFKENDLPDFKEKYFGTQIPSEELQGYDWEPETRSYFQQILGNDGKIATAISLENYYHWQLEPRSFARAK